MARERAGAWFDPKLVRVLEALEGDDGFWTRLSSAEAAALVGEIEPAELIAGIDEGGLDRVAGAFARVIDAKSPFTARHSDRVAEIAVGIGGLLGLDDYELQRLRRAGLLHDIGKLGVSNLILDKPGRLTDEERAIVERHPSHTRELLARVTPFADLADDAAGHHEKLDGTGYPLGLRGEELSQTMRVLAVADVFEAMTAARPYRAPLPVEEVLAELDAQAGSTLDRDCVGALRPWIELEADRVTSSG